jgi:hypothetical protein
LLIDPREIKLQTPNKHFLSVNLILLLAILAFGLTTISANAADTWEYHNTSDGSKVTARHEAAGIVLGNKFYVFGGRGLRPLELLDTIENKWTIEQNSSFEINHFQPVVWNGKIYAIGAFTGPFPHETNVSHIKIYDPASKSWSDGAEIPVARRRGSTGAVVHDGKIYIHGGNTNGHDGGAVAWFDEYNPTTNEWKILPDSPNVRDHYVAALVGDRLIAAGGRSTHYPNYLDNKVSKVDSYNFDTGSWETSMDDIPTPRAGTATVAHENDVIVIGGEATVGNAESAVEALNVNTGKWRALSSLLTTRHGMAAGIINDVLYVASGNKSTGGGQELDSVEKLVLETGSSGSQDSDNDGLTDSAETSIHNTNPNKADTDDDTLSDGDEVNLHNTNPLSADSDNDSLSDGDEVNFYNTSPLSADSDSDTLSDNDEINSHGTNPKLADSDSDSLDDAIEINVHLTNPLKSDSDDDGLSDSDEINQHSTNPQKSDSDGDTLTDFAEVNEYQTDPNQIDTDGDGISDASEVENETNPNDAKDPGETGGAQGNEGETKYEVSSTGSMSGNLSIMLLLMTLFRRSKVKRSGPIQFQ